MSETFVQSTAERLPASYDGVVRLIDAEAKTAALSIAQRVQEQETPAISFDALVAAVAEEICGRDNVKGEFQKAVEAVLRRRIQENAQKILTLTGNSVVRDATLEELLSQPITVLNLSIRALKGINYALRRDYLHDRSTTLRQVVSLTLDQALKAKNFAQTSLNEVREKLAIKGLCFSGDEIMLQGSKVRRSPTAIT